MGLNITLIKPNISIRRGFALQNTVYPPLGLAYLAAALLQNMHDVTIIDMTAEKPDHSWDFRATHCCYGMEDHDLIKRLQELKPDVVGITGFTAQHARIVEICHALKGALPATKIVLGGCHASTMPAFLLETTKADYILGGEGENTFVQLANALESGRSKEIRGIDGIAIPGEPPLISTKKNFEKNIDALPLPARQLFPNEVYLASGSAMPLITSRGCPNSCTFCCIHATQGHGWRPRSASCVVDEMEIVHKELGYETISIFDDAFNVRADHVVAICKEIISRKLNINLISPGGLIIRGLTKETLLWMKKAGFASVSLPFEHVSDDMRNLVIKKNLKTEKFAEVLDWCRELQLLTLVNFVIGMPGETEESMNCILEYVRRNAKRMDAVQILIATPFPGTEFYRECIDKNFLIDPAKNEFLDFDLYECLINTPTLRSETVDTYKSLIENAFLNERGDREMLLKVRRTMRKPDRESLEYVNSIYFPTLTT